MSDPDSDTFFDGMRRGTLLVQRCNSCGLYQSQLPRKSNGTAACRSCGTPKPDWISAQGIGVVVSWTVTAPYGHQETPAPGDLRTSGIVELVEGPWLYAELDDSAGPIDVGTRVVATFRATKELDGEFVPVFRASPR